MNFLKGMSYRWADADICEPKDDNLEITRTFNIAGLINAVPQFMTYPNGKVLQRISLITKGYAQLIIEIWNSDKSMEAKFSHEV